MTIYRNRKIIQRAYWQFTNFCFATESRWKRSSEDRSLSLPRISSEIGVKKITKIKKMGDEWDMILEGRGGEGEERGGGGRRGEGRRLEEMGRR